jgi:hypothetical protein
VVLQSLFGTGCDDTFPNCIRASQTKNVQLLTKVDIVPGVDKFDAAVRVGANEAVDDVRAKKRVDVGCLEFPVAVSVDSPAAEVAHGPLCIPKFEIHMQTKE